VKIYLTLEKNNQACTEAWQALQCVVAAFLQSGQG